MVCCSARRVGLEDVIENECWKHARESNLVGCCSGSPSARPLGHLAMEDATFGNGDWPSSTNYMACVLHTRKAFNELQLTVFIRGCSGSTGQPVSSTNRSRS